MFRFRVSILTLGLTIFGLIGAAQAQSVIPPNVIQTSDGKVVPAPGYAWVSTAAGDFRVRWEPGRPHPDFPNVVAGDSAPNFRPAAGYRWANNLPNDMRVVWAGNVPAGNANGAVTGPTDEAIGRAIVKIIGAVIAHQAGQPDGSEPTFFGALFSETMKITRDQLIESAVGDVFPQLQTADLQTVRRAICLGIDGNLNQASWNRSAARDDLIATLRRRDPNLATSMEVADFVGRVMSANRR